jgi:hypothetical protein
VGSRASPPRRPGGPRNSLHARHVPARG